MTEVQPQRRRGRPKGVKNYAGTVRQCTHCRVPLDRDQPKYCCRCCVDDSIRTRPLTSRCAECGASFVTKGGDNAAKCCSRECGFAWLAKMRADRAQQRRLKVPELMAVER